MILACAIFVIRIVPFWPVVDSPLVIANKAGRVATTGSAGVLDPVAAGDATVLHVPLGADESYRRTPALATAGPVTIMLSRSFGPVGDWSLLVTK